MTLKMNYEFVVKYFPPNAINQFYFAWQRTQATNATAQVLYARGGLFSKICYYMALSNTILVILGFIYILLSYIFVVTLV